MRLSLISPWYCQRRRSTNSKRRIPKSPRRKWLCNRWPFKSAQHRLDGAHNTQPKRLRVQEQARASTWKTRIACISRRKSFSNCQSNSSGLLKHYWNWIDLFLANIKSSLSNEREVKLSTLTWRRANQVRHWIFKWHLKMRFCSHQKARRALTTWTTWPYKDHRSISEKENGIQVIYNIIARRCPNRNQQLRWYPMSYRRSWSCCGLIKIYKLVFLLNHTVKALGRETFMIKVKKLRLRSFRTR